MHAVFSLLCATLIQGADSVGGPPRAATRTTDSAPDPVSIVDRVVAHGLAAGGYPGIAVVIGRRDTTLLARGYGHVDWNPTSAVVDVSRTMYDLASLTKVVATTTAIMILYDHHRLDLDAPASRYLPRWRVGAQSGVTIRDLLTHRSGLPAGRELWRLARTPAAARRAVLATPLESRPGERYAYSDLGADILGFVVEAITRQPLDQYLARHLYDRLGMRNTRFRPTRADDRRIAPTEAPLGRVHDRNAATLGGVAGHAGLFSSAGDLAILSRMMLQGGVYHGVRIVTDSAVERFTSRGWRELWTVHGHRGVRSHGIYRHIDVDRPRPRSVRHRPRELGQRHVGTPRRAGRHLGRRARRHRRPRGGDHRRIARRYRGPPCDADAALRRGAWVVVPLIQHI